MDGISTDQLAKSEDSLAGQRLRERRKVRRMTMANVAEKRSISTAQLSLIEWGLASPSVKGQREICQTLQLSVAWPFRMMIVSTAQFSLSK